MFTEDGLKRSYAACARVVRRSGSNFVRSFFLLPGGKRRAMEALYAFLRITDDLGDQAGPVSVRRQALDCWQEALTRALHQAEVLLPTCMDAHIPVPENLFALETASAAIGLENGPSRQSRPSGGASLAVQEAVGPSELEILPALVHTVRSFRIPAVYLYAVLEGVRTDLEPRRYETFEDLALYCRRVASAVGLACLCIWGCHCRQTIGPAIACGVAFQLTNILRDLQEDSLQGRVYLPLSDLAACDFCAEDFGKSPPDDRFSRLIELEVERARDFYAQAAALWDYLDASGRRIFGMMYETYRRILDRIAQDPFQVLAGQVRLTGWAKAVLAARWCLWPSRRWLLPR